MKYIYLLIDAKIRMIHQIIIANQCCNAFSVYGVCIITLVLYLSSNTRDSTICQ